MAGNVMTLLSFMIGIYSFLVLCQVQNSNAYPTGVVTSACGDMTPNHGPSSQTSVSPYTISVSPAFYQPGEQMTVTISSNAGSPALKGILLQARLTGTDQIIGVWSLEGTTGFQTLACNGVNSAVTHTSSDDKPATFQLNWTPPNVNGTDIYVTATFVQTRPVFWVAERTSDIQDACNTNGGNLCGANGNCESLVGGGINCICEEGYTGILCTTGPCDSGPCDNGGTCTYSAGDTTFTCSCSFPFGGATCQTGRLRPWCKRAPIEQQREQPKEQHQGQPLEPLHEQLQIYVYEHVLVTRQIVL
ncbi:putative defense protein Hdd11-like [Strongylocentrotus purpuratus]|uniref:Reelin n=1 Tax=Strongylocentrotus purpuratus TaxID=7668 RepID=A0A7M7P8T7_STRPU|nr:putative defense protein Hdd11-like [Strongylocentrotus purpuratus]